ncbi:hypothetical protein [Acidovorax sp. MR-S7]|uniref:hypothetical protein n=1 Tax=Acidovorax sp. MR-S7 TaxID=1268622 RepID=UPI000363D2E7|nr:hypothetical protein [Acidovorax sp. MR-S7]GAD20930.1 hypothetical protein AVS7_00691 [Acidovorax sp. MR-S7]
MSNQLIKYEAACRALAECKAVDEVKAWADKAAAMQAYGKMAKDKTLEVTAAEIRIRAERRLGEMLAQQKSDGGLSKGAAGAGVNQHTPKEVRSSAATAPKLADAGISKDLSSRAQKLAAVPEAEFEAEVAQWKDRVSAEGARVSARLEKKGAQRIKEAEKLHVVAPTGDVITEADLHEDPADLLEELQRDNEELQKQIAILTADDTKAELHKMILQRDHAVRQQSEAMDKAALNQKFARRLGNQVKECCDILGVDDPRYLVSTLRKLVAQQKEAA